MNRRAQGNFSKHETADGKPKGGWIEGKIVSTGTGAMVGVDLGARTMRVNVSKLRRKMSFQTLKFLLRRLKHQNQKKPQ